MGQEKAAEEQILLQKIKENEDHIKYGPLANSSNERESGRPHCSLFQRDDLCTDVLQKSHANSATAVGTLEIFSPKGQHQQISGSVIASADDLSHTKRPLGQLLDFINELGTLPRPKTIKFTPSEVEVKELTKAAQTEDLGLDEPTMRLCSIIFLNYILTSQNTEMIERTKALWRELLSF